MTSIPRSEHPTPQFLRDSWMNLNGTWDFCFDFGKSGQERKQYLSDDYPLTIQVPFCPESALSGIGHTDFIPAVWYRKVVPLTEVQLSGRTLLHIGAADYHSFVYINGELAGSHKGGFSSFTLDITDFVRAGDNSIVIYVEDDVRNPLQPRGKQCECFHSCGCDYTRVTGIWQTVWLEFVPQSYIREFRLFPDIDNSFVTICVNIENPQPAHKSLQAKALWKGVVCGSVVTNTSDTSFLTFVLPLNQLHLWELGTGGLYDLELSYGEDVVHSYFGMRQIELRDQKFYLNHRPVFQRTVLDQGFYPDGIYTAPSEEALIRDIEISMQLGFNGARLHQKAFEPLFLYHCDRLGYMVWGEYGNWGLDTSQPLALHAVFPEWMELLHRDFNHPSIIGWCPYNETWDYQGKRQLDDNIRLIYLATKSFDTTRPCIDTSGNYHVGNETDIYDLHNYNQNPAEFAACFDAFGTGGKLTDYCADRQSYDYRKKLPVFISEYGGIKWDIDMQNKDAWGYGNAPQTEEEFLERYQKLTECLLNNPKIMGFCYTQLYDIEQETNGLCTYSRKFKFDPEVIRSINTAPAACEQEDYTD